MINKRNKNERVAKAILPAIIFFVLIILLIPAAQNAWSQAGRIYSGDGSRLNPTVPPGGWIYPQGTIGSCLTCHNSGVTSMFNRPVPDMTAYLRTGHKNMLRSAQTPPIQIAGPEGTAYISDEAGNVINWTDNTIDILGFCSNSETASQSVCTAGGGIWISGKKSLYYILGGWMLEPAAPLAVFDGYDQGSNKTAVSYGCGRCHTTGYTMDEAVSGSRSPEAGFPRISWTPANTTGKVDFDPDGDGRAISGSWAVDGITCERCHDATNHMNGGPTITRGADATALCMNCHRQEHTLPYTGGGLGANIVPTPYTDNVSLPASEPLYPLPAIEIGGYSGYALQFYGYSTGNEFLNGAHGGFTGNFAQIGDPSRYTSSFSAYEDPEHEGVGTGCTTCHDVHQSTVKAVNATAPFKKDCPECHADKVITVQTRMTHAPGDGDPLGNCAVEDIACACKLCHMPSLNQRSTSSSHIFRISTNASYSTFPTQEQWDAGQRTANTVGWWDLACRQCHVEQACTYDPNNADLNPACEQCHASPDLSSGMAMHSGVTLDDSCRTCHLMSPCIYDPAQHASCAQCHEGADLSAAMLPHYQVKLDVDLVCGQCHVGGGGSGYTEVPPWGTGPMNKATLAREAKGIHKDWPQPSFGFSPPISLTLVVNASASLCYSSNPCSEFRWNWGDGTKDTFVGVATASHTYLAAGTYTVTLTVIDAGNSTSASTSKKVTVYKADEPPTASHSNPVVLNADTWVATIVDSSTDDNGVSLVKITNWGDGSPQQSGPQGTVFTHTYTTAGLKTITHEAVDTIGQSRTETLTVTPATFTITGKVYKSDGVTPVSSATVKAVKGSSTITVSTNSSGTYTVSNLKPGTYDILVTKYNYVFSAPSATVTVGPSGAGINIIALSP